MGVSEGDVKTMLWCLVGINNGCFHPQHHDFVLNNAFGNNRNDCIVATNGMLSKAVGCQEYPLGLDQDPSSVMDMAICLGRDDVWQATLLGVHTTCNMEGIL